VETRTVFYDDSSVNWNSVGTSVPRSQWNYKDKKARRLELHSIMRMADDLGITEGHSYRAKHDTGKLAKVKFRWLVAGDATACVLSILLAYLVVDYLKSMFLPFYDRLTVAEAIGLAPLLFILPFFGVLLLCQHKGHYSRFKCVWDELGEFWLICLCMVGITVACLYFSQHKFSRFWLLTTWATIMLLVPFARFVVKKQLKKRNYWFTPTVIVGTGPNALSAALALESDENMGFKVVSMIDATLPEPTSSMDVSHLVVRDELKKCNKQYPVNMRLADSVPYSVSQSRPYVVLALEAEDYIDHQDVVEEFLVSRRNLSIFPPVKAVPLIGTEIDPIYRHEALHLRVRINLANWRSRFLKRSFDLVLSSLGLVLFSPLFILLYLIVRLDGGPAFYGQERVGCGGRKFRCWKFRSMHANADRVLARYLQDNPALSKEYTDTQKLENDPRVTSFGRFIRKYSLDEIPQLFNVFLGSMSLVGPRPVRLDELRSKYGSSAKYYLLSAPGITGVWQTSGRSALNYATRVKLDVWYVRNWTLWGDVKIIFNTTSVVLAGHGAY